MSKKIIIANLKMHGSSSFYEDLFAQVKSTQQHLAASDVEIIMCIPYPSLFLAEKFCMDVIDVQERLFHQKTHLNFS